MCRRGIEHVPTARTCRDEPWLALSAPSVCSAVKSVVVANPQLADKPFTNDVWADGNIRRGDAMMVRDQLNARV